MSEHSRYQIHIRILNQIKNRPNQYPVYKVNVRNNSSNPRKLEIDKLLSQIKSNSKNISIIQKGLKKKKPVNYDSDMYIYDREVENIQKQMMNKLINKNKNLKNQVKFLQENYLITRSKKYE